MNCFSKNTFCRRGSLRRLRLSETGVVIDKRGGVDPPLRRVNSNGVQQNQLSGLLEMLFHTIPVPINIDAKRANRVVEIKMLAMAVPQKVRMQIIRHGVG